MKEKINPQKNLFLTHSDTVHTAHTQPLSNREIIDSYDYLSGAASSQDCTGLIPSAPLNDAELDSYEEIYPFLPPVPPSAKSGPDSGKQ